MSKIGIIDADLINNGTRHPNLALMKISAYEKELENEVTLLENYEDIPEYDHVFISKVFSFTEVPENLMEYENISIGGTGFFADGGKPLIHDIEHHMPDYHLYDSFICNKLKKGFNVNYFSDYQHYSIGFTTRGCFRKCDFCVNKKYDRVFKHSQVSEFLDVDRPKIYLWDDNFLAFDGWREILDELEATKKPFQFRQGLDIRLMTDEKAERLAHMKYSGDFIFAFDHIADRGLIEERLILWKKHCKKTTKLYVLTGYASQDEIDIKDTFERIKILMKHGCIPYIMRYESYKGSKFKGMYVQLARWCNQPQFFKKKSFRQFCEANQQYHSSETLCAPCRAMTEFEKAFPEIAKEYFDMRFDEERLY